ncbi:MAG: NAD-dependent epimerase/dehydratase family protein [Alphaproteobacteria bacterium]
MANNDLHLITGGSGFVGSHIARQLLAKKQNILLTDIWQNDEFKDHFAYLDVTDKAAVDKVMKHVTHIHHNAALVPLAKAGKKFHEVNVVGTKNIIDMGFKHNIKMLCNMSSSAIFGLAKTMPILPNAPLQPIEQYGKAKADADKLVQQAMKDGLPACLIRPRTVIGKERLGIFEILFDWIKDDANIFIIGKGNNLFQFVQVEDLANVSVRASLLKKSGLFNVGGLPFGCLRHDLEAFIKKVGAKSKVISLPIGLAKLVLLTADKLKLSPLGPWHYLSYHKDFYYDITHITKALGWQPKYGNVDMMVDSYRWYLKNYSSFDKTHQSTHRKPVPRGILSLAKQASKIF